MTKTNRMRRATERTLDGYIFTDRAHAREWLRQPFVDMAGIQLEEVEVGPLVPCPRCGGSGHRRDVRVIRRLTTEEALNV